MTQINLKALGQEPKENVRREIHEAIALAQKLLPETASNVTVEFERRRENSGVGVGGYVRASGVMVLAWDDEFSDKGAQLQALRAEILHQAYHWCQGYTYEEPAVQLNTALESAIYEGAASVFARAYAVTHPAWTEYRSLPLSTLQEWRTKLASIPATLHATSPELWRKWSGPSDAPADGWRSHRVGTWMVDEYLARTGISILDLRKVPAKKIIATL